MAKRDDETIGLPDETEDTLVPAVFARSPAEADVYCELLSDHEIPAIVGDEDSLAGGHHPARHGMTHGLPVLVPEPMLDEAGEVIANREESEGLLTVDDDDPDEDYDDDDHFGLREIDDDEDVFGGGEDI